MAGCDTCRRRKVKCDGRSGICERCDKLGLQCLRDAPTKGPHAGTIVVSGGGDADLTQAGHKRLRTTAACGRCRSKKLKCDALKPACSLCAKKGHTCEYVATTKRRGSKLSHSKATPTDTQLPAEQRGEKSSQEASSAAGSSVSSQYDDEDIEMSDNHKKTASPSKSNSSKRARQTGSQSRPLVPRGSVASTQPVQTPDSQLRGPNEPPSGRHVLPYLDSFLENVHPISCNNFLHPGSLCAGIDRAPPLLLLAICGSSAKFMPEENSGQKGSVWVDEAKSIVMRNLSGSSTLTISAIQFLALHEMHEGNYTSAWNLVGIAIRMTLDLRLYETNPSTSFLQQECRRRLMWAVFVSDLLFDNDQLEIDMNLLLDVPLPCNLWSFTQGIPCKTLTLRQMQNVVDDVATQQSSNHCAFLISILVTRRKILRYIRSIHAAMDCPWMEGSMFSSLRNEIFTWKSNLPRNYAFNERHMYMFRVSRHLDIFMMIHAYYHQCCVLLFGIFLPESIEPNLEQVAAQAPPQFLQDCAEEFLLHAKEISHLIQRVFNVEPDHLFRDPWFSVCIWDGTCALLSAIPWQESDAQSRVQAVELLKANLHALENSMPKMPLAEQIYRRCCAAIRHYGLEEAVGLTLPPMNSDPDTASALHLERFYQRYLFFSTTKTREVPEWDELLAASGTNVVDDEEEAAKASRRSSMRTSNSRPKAPMESDSTVSVTPFNAVNGLQGEMSPFWTPDDVQWWQLQNSYVDPNTFANTVPGTEMGHMQL
ncbi:hypothetical protein QQS21_011125 [Conoideocrella luteorostrata]|uniref:Zn(2)-C6 fungal-type domain-containing protein n=1 Tax=Conoideocrella luteorostrata TaxID=1105319 RepID=A0AAJ0FNP6_9HYPO|nr:hypothetical protein QQS21_011125 [Conoideocrella luteorostrata]